MNLCNLPAAEEIDCHGQFIRIIWPDNDGYEGYEDDWFCRVCGEQVDDPYDPDCECNL
ncbi:hypothetical protein Selin_1429 [Desulfurispirillum indicum S5]|uniref:Uncharacterized protein n=1 Tax=Desulfurispirillum indicum (strain ATCC BAA-1389 / DSM 22839 / S5) TaxID=653733 RepID=E6W6C7_DESIS|nr:hypothetical protein Selin_1429 [Desulfurispirillum indicum S5]